MKIVVYPIQIESTEDAIRICKEAAAADLGVTISINKTDTTNPTKINITISFK